MRRLTRVRLRPISFAVGLSLFAIQFPLLGGILTTNRLGVAVLVLGCIAQGRRGRVFAVRRGSAITLLLVPLFVLIGFSVASYIFSSPRDSATFAPIASWVLIGVSVLAAYELWSGFDDSDAGVVLRWFIVIGAGITLYTFAYALAAGSLRSMADYYSLRHLLNEFGGGVNRHLVGLLTLNVFSVAAVVGLHRTPLWLLLTAWADVAMFVILTVLMGSRQTLLGIALVTAIMLLIRPRRRARWNRHQRMRAVVVGSLGLLIIGVGLQRFDLGDWFERRFIATTVQQANEETEYGRVAIALTGIEIAFSSPVVGIGPGAFEGRAGHAAHNGYIGIAAEVGLFPVFVLIGAWLLVLVHSWRLLRQQLPDTPTRSFLAIGTCYMLVYVPVLTLLNDLTRQYIPWVVMAALVAKIDYSKAQRVRNALSFGVKLGSTRRYTAM